MDMEKSKVPTNNEGNCGLSQAIAHSHRNETDEMQALATTQTNLMIPIFSQVAKPEWLCIISLRWQQIQKVAKTEIYSLEKYL